MLRTFQSRVLASTVVLTALSFSLIGAAPLPPTDTIEEGIWIPGATLFLMPLPLGPNVAEAPLPDGQGQTQAAATGACCFDPGVCAVVLESKCNQLGGAYQGDGTTCLDTCPGPNDIGACCFGSLGIFCTEVTKPRCIEIGGTWQGPATTCATTCGDVWPY